MYSGRAISRFNNQHLLICNFSNDIPIPGELILTINATSSNNIGEADANTLPS